MAGFHRGEPGNVGGRPPEVEDSWHITAGNQVLLSTSVRTHHSISDVSTTQSEALEH